MRIIIIVRCITHSFFIYHLKKAAQYNETNKTIELSLGMYFEGKTVKIYSFVQI
jgi:hypothetical protein